jgi:hypothetical protein
MYKMACQWKILIFTLAFSNVNMYSPLFLITIYFVAERTEEKHTICDFGLKKKMESKGN